jgi:trimeric autotransporter adhesin
MKRYLFLLLFLLAPLTAHAQGSVQQYGIVTQDNLAAWRQNGIIYDSGINSITLNFPTIANSHLLGNATGSSAAAQDTSLTALIDTLCISAAHGNVLYRGASSWGCLAAGTSGQFLKTLGAGSNPAWDTPSGTSYTAGTGLDLTGGVFSLDVPVTVANGGTGLTAGTSGGVPFFSGSTTIGSSAALSANRLVIGGGAGVAPYTLSSAGTSGYVLTSNGASADPSWSAAATGTVTSVAANSGLTGGPITATGTLSCVAAAASTKGCVTPDADATHFLNGNGGWTVPYAPLAGTSASIGGGSLSTDTCTSGTAAVTGATTSMAVVATPGTYPGDGFVWKAYVSASDVVTVKVCNFTAGSLTPTASTYVVRAFN